MTRALILAGDDFPLDYANLTDQQVSEELDRVRCTRKCSDYAAEAFHFDPAGPLSLVEFEASAPALCDGCPIIGICLEYGLRFAAADRAVYGGTGRVARAELLELRKATDSPVDQDAVLVLDERTGRAAYVDEATARDLAAYPGFIVLGLAAAAAPELWPAEADCELARLRVTRSAPARAEIHGAAQ
ncbi:hypothetical protein [Catellatospora sp. NPDC049133]|uniref:hypothetical protein n=1 Tax=Catellatospora sp. NPDC049133 TaxID=3155499 RepID=UPI0033FD1112